MIGTLSWKCIMQSLYTDAYYATGTVHQFYIAIGDVSTPADQYLTFCLLKGLKQIFTSLAQT